MDFANLVSSPLGEDKKLFLMSYTAGVDAIDYVTQVPNVPPVTNYLLPFTNPAVDLIDVHLGLYPDINCAEPPCETGANIVDWRMHEGFKHATDFWNTFPSPSASLSERKPFNHGEFNHYTAFEVPNPLNPVQPFWKGEIEKIFHNYNVSFHNELWSSAFSGKFAAGTSWIWDRVFWWPRSMPTPPSDQGNPFQFSFLNSPGATNTLSPGGVAIAVPNRGVYHHFKTLAALLNHPSWLELNFFDNELEASTLYDPDTANTNLLECYYLKSTDSAAAIGWIHNRKASVMNNFYIVNQDSTQNFFGCVAPVDTAVVLPGFLPNTEYHITWFPTWQNSTECPLDTVWQTNGVGALLLDLSTAPFGDTIQTFMDTLHADYAFIITLGDFVKSRSAEEPTIKQHTSDWDFDMYPNPAHDVLFLRLTDDSPKEISVFDVSGRRVVHLVNARSLSHTLAMHQLSRGAYWVRVSGPCTARMKKLVIQ